MNENRLQTAGAVVLLLLLAPFVVFAVPQVAGASQSYVVLSDSMSPEIRAGDVVIVDDTPTERIEEGDVITYESVQSSQLVTHRVVDVRESSDGTAFRTKGDANEDPDPRPIPAENVVGVVAFHIPLVGHVISFGGSDLGIVVFVIVPAVLLAASEIYDLYQDATTDTTESTGGGD
jgi:signal peptidase